VTIILMSGSPAAPHEDSDLQGVIPAQAPLSVGWPRISEGCSGISNTTMTAGERTMHDAL